MMTIDLSRVSDSANEYWRKRTPKRITARRGECCLCSNDATFYDSQGTGYCMSHWQGCSLVPGLECAELMHRDKDDYWVIGTVVIEAPTGKAGRYGHVWTRRHGQGKPYLVAAARLLPLSSKYPKVKFWMFSEVFDVADYSVKGEVIKVDTSHVDEDRSESNEIV